VLIIGAGFGGLGMAMRLKRAGMTDFIILEQAADIGGTWRDNTYPGACCDTKAFAYCYSFEQKTDWTRKWVPWSEILAYMHHCLDKYGLTPHLRLGREVASARFDETSTTWVVSTTSGETYTADVLISCVGQLNRPAVPAIDGQDDFAGPSFHSARWDHGVELEGRRVGVIGNAASAIQFIPEIADQAARVTVFQRSANWMIHRGNRPFRAFEKRLFGASRLLSRLYRSWIWAYYELFIYPVILGWPGFRQAGEWLAKRAIRADISDPVLRDQLVPDYPIGAKRILVSDDYYSSLNRANVELVTDGIRRITRSGIVTVDGTAHELDVLIYGTGFRSTEFLAPMDIRGRGGRSLREGWKSTGAEAYLGITVPGFPNFFMLYGPNTNLGHYSIIFMLEQQAGYVLACLERLVAGSNAAMEVRDAVCRQYNDRLQERLARSTWAAVDHSWYMDRGRITNNWPGSTSAYWWQTRRVRDADFVFTPARPATDARPHPAPG
jgi:cation diffusion facilitator CzcD-associated flavoprotein CzcO